MYYNKITALVDLISQYFSPVFTARFATTTCKVRFSHVLFRNLHDHLNDIHIPWLPYLYIDEEPRDRLVWCKKHPINCRSLWGRSKAQSCEILASSVALLSSARWRDC